MGALIKQIRASCHVDGKYLNRKYMLTKQKSKYNTYIEVIGQM
jgi:hypothetical protein